MRYIVPTVEQLDQAATELQEAAPVSNRVSLILTDNAVELMLHRRCDGIFNRERQFHQERATGRYGRAARHRALGPHYDEKLKFLKAEGDIDEHEYNFIRICHD